jgi:hypothetical protein
MGDERREMIAADRAVFEQEIQEMRHLLEIGRHIGVIAPEMNIVELKMNDPLDLVPRRLQLAGRLKRRSRLHGCGYGRKGDASKQDRRQQLASEA